MPEIYYAWAAIMAGFVGLIWSADRFVGGSAAIATHFGIPKIVIGLTIVALGTSAPEIVVSISAALDGIGNLAVGNALGSNLANIGLVLGVTALIAPLPIKSYIFRQELPILLGVMAVAGWFLYDAVLTQVEGIVLVSLLIPLLYWLAVSKKKQPENADEEDIPDYSVAIGALWFVAGLIVLIASSETLVWGAKVVADSFGVSELIIGLTVVAIGTSLPELAASVISALKGHHDIALGNVIGSNMFNLLIVMGIAPIIAPITMEASVFLRDYSAMIAITLLLGTAMATTMWLKKSEPKMGASIGIMLLLAYGAYYWLLFS